MKTDSVRIPAQTLERLRNWQRTALQIQGVMQATVDALSEAQGVGVGATVDLESGVWVMPQNGDGGKE